jgi:hypothetical protein
MKYLILSLIFAWGISPAIYAQKDLQISKVFETYGERKGVIMVDVTGEVLQGYDFALFKSLTIKNDPAAADFIRKCLLKDEEGAKKVRQVVVSGKPTSIYLQLPRIGKYSRLILFNEATKPTYTITLVYIESENDSEDVLKLILKKK